MGEKGDGKGDGGQGQQGQGQQGQGQQGQQGSSSSSSSSASAGSSGGGSQKKDKPPADSLGLNNLKSTGTGIDDRPITQSEKDLMRDLLLKKYGRDQADIAWKESQQLDNAAYRELLAGLKRELGY